MNNSHIRFTRPAAFSSAVTIVAALTSQACADPLPAENPKTHLDEPVQPIAIQVDTTRSSEAPASSAPAVAEAPPPPTYKDVGLKTPESVLYEATSDVYLVSNINGAPPEKDNNGFISILAPDGSVKALKFIAGGENGVTLDAPKGMGISGDVLYVSDIQDVRKFDLKTGAPKGSIHIPKATFLNDVAVDAQGTVYVSDSGRKAGKEGLEPSGTDALYKLVGDKAVVVVKGKQLEGPNGVNVDADGIEFATMGGDSFVRINAAGKELARAHLPGGGLDGIVRLADGSYLVSSWQGQAVYRGGFTQPFVAVLKDAPSSADIGYDSKRDRILIPVLMQDLVRTVALPESDAPKAVANPAPKADELVSASPASSAPSAAPPKAK
jgi:sugar lactone lactonase YvrE